MNAYCPEEGLLVPFSFELVVSDVELFCGRNGLERGQKCLKRRFPASNPSAFGVRGASESSQQSWNPCQGDRSFVNSSVIAQSWSSLVEGVEGLYLPNCRSSLIEGVEGPIVKQIALVMLSLYKGQVHKHNSLPLGQIRAFISLKQLRSPAKSCMNIIIGPLNFTDEIFLIMHQRILMCNPRPLFGLFWVFLKQIFKQINVKNVHQLYGAVILTHDL